MIEHSRKNELRYLYTDWLEIKTLNKNLVSFIDSEKKNNEKGIF